MNVFDIRAYETLTSTMDEMRRLFEENKAQTGVVVHAHTQTRGRGRFTRAWNSLPGNLFATVMWSVPRTSLGWYSMMMAFAMKDACDALFNTHTVQVATCVKWPNDFLVDRKKIGGVLVEVLGEDTVQKDMLFLSIGFGLNIFSTPESHNMTFLPCSLVEFLKKENSAGLNVPTAGEILTDILHCFTDLHGHFQEKGYISLKNLFLEGTPKGTPLTLKNGDKMYEGIFHDLTKDGHLMLDLVSGERKTFSAGDISV